MSVFDPPKARTPRGRNPNGLGTVYALIDPQDGDLRYVGKTICRPEDRLGRHIADARRGKHWGVAGWIRSLGNDEPEMIILEECAIEDVFAAEHKWVLHYRNLGGRLTNLTDGGDGMYGFRLSDEARAKIGAAHRGKVVSTETRALQRAAKLGKKQTIEHRAKVSVAARGRKDSEATRQSKRLAQRKSFQNPQRRAQLQAALALRWARYRDAREGGI